MPFVREVFLMECPVAGTSHRNLVEVEPALKEKAPPAIRILDRPGLLKVYRTVLLLEGEGPGGAVGSIV